MFTAVMTRQPATLEPWENLKRACRLGSGAGASLKDKQQEEVRKGQNTESYTRYNLLQSSKNKKNVKKLDKKS